LLAAIKGLRSSRVFEKPLLNIQVGTFGSLLTIRQTARLNGRNNTGPIAFTIFSRTSASNTFRSNKYLITLDLHEERKLEPRVFSPLFMSDLSHNNANRHILQHFVTKAPTVIFSSPFLINSDITYTRSLNRKVQQKG
jgi:hypothetical protein